MSPSPRRAWIEMRLRPGRLNDDGCRPPHGGRGLKCDYALTDSTMTASPSPRRAWIEILSLTVIQKTERRSRPPHGGRGLKYVDIDQLQKAVNVALPTEGVD